MKIYEIISENSIQEGLPADVLGGIAKYGLKAAKFFKGDKELVAATAEKISSLAKTRNIDIDAAAALKATMDKADIKARVMKFGETEEEAAEYLGISRDQEVIKKAIAKAKTQAGLDTLGLGNIKISPLGLAKGAVTAALTGWNLYQLVKPYTDFVSKMDDYKKTKLDTGAWTEDQYNAVLNQEATIMLGRWAVLLASSSVYFALSKIPYFGAPFRALGIVGAAVFKTWINNKDNANYIAALIADNIPELAQSIGEIINNFLANYVPDKLSLNLGVGTVSQNLRPTIPGADNPDSEYNQQKKIAGSPNGTSQNAIDQTSDAGNTTVNPATGRTASGRKMYYNDNWHSNNQDITGWVEDPSNPKMIQDPNNPVARALKPPGWRPD
jgi:hypothetical protein